MAPASRRWLPARCTCSGVAMSTLVTTPMDGGMKNVVNPGWKRPSGTVADASSTTSSTSKEASRNACLNHGSSRYSPGVSITAPEVYISPVLA